MTSDVLTIVLLFGFVVGTAFGYAIRSYISRRRRRKRIHLLERGFGLAPPSRASGPNTAENVEAVTLAPTVEDDAILRFRREKR